MRFARVVQVIFLIKDYKQPGQTLGRAVVEAPPFWLVLILTCSIILPWLRLRKVPVRAEVLSNHCVRLHFDYGKSFLFKLPSSPPAFLQFFSAYHSTCKWSLCFSIKTVSHSFRSLSAELGSRNLAALTFSSSILASAY